MNEAFEWHTNKDIQRSLICFCKFICSTQNYSSAVNISSTIMFQYRHMRYYFLCLVKAHASCTSTKAIKQKGMLEDLRICRERILCHSTHHSNNLITLCQKAVLAHQYSHFKGSLKFKQKIIFICTFEFIFACACKHMWSPSFASAQEPIWSFYHI